MSTSIPPFNGQFSYINETWETIGWAVQSDDGTYIWCHPSEAAFVIGKKVGISPTWNCIAPVAAVGRASRTRAWKYNLPDYLRTSQQARADANVGRQVRVVSGQLEID
jgi:hypothetical protein